MVIRIVRPTDISSNMACRSSALNALLVFTSGSALAKYFHITIKLDPPVNCVALAAKKSFVIPLISSVTFPPLFLKFSASSGEPNAILNALVLKSFQNVEYSTYF